MPSELDAHDILFSPLKKRRAEQSARRAADQPEPPENAAVRSRVRPDSDAPPTDRAVAYAIPDTDAGPLVSSKMIAGIAVAAAIATAAVLMRTPKLEAGAQDEATADERTWWTAAREQWANETMRVWPIVIRKGRSMTTTAAAGRTPAIAAPNAVLPSSRANQPARSNNAYSNTPLATQSPGGKQSDNPYGETPAPRARKPAATSTDNPY